MKIKNILIIFSIFNCMWICSGEHEEDIPYQQVDVICKTCICEQQKERYALSCKDKGFKHILARWPEEFGQDHLGEIIFADFSGNSLSTLQQIPATNATLIFICRNCGIKEFQQPTFMDVPNIQQLDLSHNNITTTLLSPAVFRGPFHESSYEPIAIVVLNLAYNQLHALDKKLFEHLPKLSNLSLSHNPFKVLDLSTISALSSIRNLMHLDLSYTNLDTIPTTLFNRLYVLKTLNLAGNDFKVMPSDSFLLLGKTLETLNLAQNLFSSFNETSFKGLQKLIQLNLSYMPQLHLIRNSTFAALQNLEILYLNNNPQLNELDLNVLKNNSKLKIMDISHNQLKKIYIEFNVTANWQQLSVSLQDNPWWCDCAFAQALEFIGSQNLEKDKPVRCMEPFQLAGDSIFNLNASAVCAMQLTPRFPNMDEHTPRFLHRKYIMQYIYLSIFVLLVGVIIGLSVVYLKRRIKRADFGTEPIRYTSVRSSNISAISQLQQAEQRRSDRMSAVTRIV